MDNFDSKSHDTTSSSNSTDITCNKCNISFSARKNLYRHQRKFHSEDELSIPRTKICPVCCSKFRNIVELHKHITIQHEDINLKFEKEVFYTDCEFLEWKSEFEKKTGSYFTFKGKHESDKKTVSYYECHRSGEPVLIDDSKRIRHTKYSGSIKTGKTCPASMKVIKEMINEATEIVVQYQSIHVGHVVSLQCPQNIKYSICEHIHFFCENVDVSATHACPNDDENGSFVIATAQDESREKQSLDESFIIHEVQKKPGTDINTLKSDLALKLKSISNQIQNLETVKDVKNISGHVETLETHLKTISSNPNFPNVLGTPSENKTVQQRKFKTEK